MEEGRVLYLYISNSGTRYLEKTPVTSGSGDFVPQSLTGVVVSRGLRSGGVPLTNPRDTNGGYRREQVSLN